MQGPAGIHIVFFIDQVNTRFSVDSSQVLFTVILNAAIKPLSSAIGGQTQCGETRMPVVTEKFVY